MLENDVLSGKIISYTQHSSGSFDVLSTDTMQRASKKAS